MEDSAYIAYTVLIVEDDLDINILLRDILKADFEVSQAFNEAMALSFLRDNTANLVLLDLMLPDVSGESLISLIKESADIPIIVLTAKAEVDVLVKVLELGAQDYIAKPFDTKEVRARINKQLNHKTIQTLMVCDLKLDDQTHEAFYKQHPLTLTSKEFDLLKLLMNNPKKVFTKANLYESVWQDAYFGDDNTITVHMSRLRTKLNKYSNEELIETIWGVGFKLNI